MNSNIKQELKSWAKSIFIALGVVVVLRTFLFSPYTVEGSSMDPTLHNKEKVFVNKFNVSNHFERGEIVIIKGDSKNYVKRIIGLPGDTIEMKKDQLLINGVLFEETYLTQKREEAERMGLLLTGDFGPITVPDDEFFVMGDNRLYSMDSRNGLGYIQKDRIIGTTEFVYFPFKSIRDVD
ncbi:signal peptidase I [Fredinandcohnia humi]